MLMKWMLVVSMFAWSDVDPALFATETECLAAAAAFVEAIPSFEWVDDPRESQMLIQPVVRATAEWVGVDDD